ncbi:hypothetical protein [Streptomyces sp. NPDC046197]|uniref:hypothetical protein n=1 Tax=Streptomyces sp. NPDC046197 TaxID=3154337 RepID=UPI0033CDDB98
MPTFRQPEWQQPADRHTQLVDPVLTVRQLSRFEFNFRSLVRIDHALVFSTPKGSYEAYLPPSRPTRAEIAARRYTAVYEVDMGVHPYTAELTLPSDNDAFEFTAEVDLSWQVLDPARFVASGHRDVPALVLGELQQAARPVTRRFPIAESAAAEGELLQAVTVLGPLGAPAGLQVTWTLRVRRDQANIEHQQRLQAIDHSAVEQVHVAQRGMEVDVEMDRRQRQQDSLQIDRAMAYGTQQQELILQQQRWQYEQAMLASGQQHQLALQQGHQQLELQQIEAQKIAYYQWHLQQGGVHTWALHLAQHPEDSQLVMSSMRDDQLRMIRAQMDLVKQLLSGDTAENYELEGPKQLALRTVSDILNQRLPGVPQTPPPLPEGAGPAYPANAQTPPAGEWAAQPGATDGSQAVPPPPEDAAAQGSRAWDAGSAPSPAGLDRESGPSVGAASAGAPSPTGPYQAAAAHTASMPGPAPTATPSAPPIPDATPFGFAPQAGTPQTPMPSPLPGPGPTTSPFTSPIPGTGPTIPPIPGTSPTTPPIPGASPFSPPIPGTGPLNPPIPGTSPLNPPIPTTGPSTPPLPGTSTPPAVAPDPLVPPPPGTDTPYGATPAHGAATPNLQPPAAAYAPPPPAWEPPPGYGTTPTVPGRQAPAASAEEAAAPATATTADGRPDTTGGTSGDAPEKSGT